jgi:hypothetical protein
MGRMKTNDLIDGQRSLAVKFLFEDGSLDFEAAIPEAIHQSIFEYPAESCRWLYNWRFQNIQGVH